MEHPSRSLIELLSQQQSAPGGELGIRLSLHWDLLERLDLQKYPLFYCAATGNTALALHLYKNGHYSDQQVFIATLTSGGVNGQATWHKALAASPADVARLAGHARLGNVLDNIEAGVPLTWSPALHHMYPSVCRDQVKKLVRALCRSWWFIRLPGPARAMISRIAICDVCRAAAWGMVQVEEWRAADQGDFGTLNDAVLAIIKDIQSNSAPSTSSSSAGGASSSSSSSNASASNAIIPATGLQSPAAGAAPQHGILCRADIAHQAQEHLQLSSLMEPLRQFHFRLALAQPGGAAANAAGAAGRARGRGRWLRLLWGSLVPLAALIVTARECRRLRREQVAVYVAGTLAGLQLPSVILMVVQLLSGGL